MFLCFVGCFLFGTPGRVPGSPKVQMGKGDYIIALERVKNKQQLHICPTSAVSGAPPLQKAGERKERGGCIAFCSSGHLKREKKSFDHEGVLKAEAAPSREFLLFAISENSWRMKHQVGSYRQVWVWPSSAYP